MLRRREIAKRVFAFELLKSTHTLEEDGIRYLLTPTGAKVNRIFMIGVLLDKEETEPESGFWRFRLNDLTATIYGFAGKYQQEAVASLLELMTPQIVAIVGKPRVFEGEARKFVSVIPEDIVAVDIETRNIWIVETAKLTLERIRKMEEKADEDEDETCKLAWSIYDPNLNELKDVVREVLKNISERKEREEKERKPKIEIEEETREFKEEISNYEFEEDDWDLMRIWGLK